MNWLKNILNLTPEQGEVLDKIEEIYGQDVESLRGWPLIKLQQFDAARASANKVLENSENERERARAWNTLCAVELASLQPAFIDLFWGFYRKPPAARDAEAIDSARLASQRCFQAMDRQLQSASWLGGDDFSLRAYRLFANDINLSSGILDHRK